MVLRRSSLLVYPQRLLRSSERVPLDARDHTVRKLRCRTQLVKLPRELDQLLCTVILTGRALGWIIKGTTTMCEPDLDRARVTARSVLPTGLPPVMVGVI